MPNLLILFGPVLVLYTLIKLSKRPPHFPPGPRGLPLLGYLSPVLSKKESFFKAMQKLAKKYGPVTGFYLGPNQPLISVVGTEAVREALQNKDLDGRLCGALQLHSLTFGERLGITFVEGDVWKKQRKFTHRQLRELGFGKTSIENQMMNEITELMSIVAQTAQSHPDHVVDFESIFSVSVINIIWAIIGGKSYPQNDRTIGNLSYNISRFLESGGDLVTGNLPVPAFLLRLFPYLPKLIGMKTYLFMPIQKLIQDTIDEHLLTRIKEDAPRDFIDVYLAKMEEQLKKDCSSTYSKKQLIAIIQDLAIAGFHTSSSTIVFAILSMINYPIIQQKVRDELEEICGDSLPSLAHQPRLPYTEAVLMEVMRMSPIAPLAVPHRAMKDTQLQGFTIPKGSVLAINLDSVFKDPIAWGDPEIFRPERHLDQEGKIFRNDAFIPFGLGKRVCLGEALARNTVFLFIASFVKTFQLKSLPNQPPPTLEPAIGFVSNPQPFKAVVIPCAH
ncbi:methyl farnesoate epoxidase-like [Daphnia pulex]|uniref:methyl farnesoate epoxidase-like n=1 Tax=Daphnia pulex TaxID=6669 RepID=UPI001EE0B5A3|nr:methyl farnesoate epoxidase-like [Daphnia pulex]